ncbi:MAG: carboxypeptidase regulatory-like domain-containing protein [Terriglobia bacterium]
MKFRLFSSLISVGIFVPLVLAGQLFAQSSAGALRGQVVDPSGATVPGAAVSVSSANGRKASAKTNGNGKYEIKGLAPGTYTVHVTAQNFSSFEQANVTVLAGRVRKLNVSLNIEQQVQQVTVSAQATHLSVAPENNASAVVITGKALQSLSDDPDELEAELEALAGPAAGPNGGQIYIDGFTGGDLPPKQDILAIHINENPFSAQYDKVGYGRIDITTKPGSSQYHGGFFVDGNDSSFNSRNPFVTQVPPYYADFMNGDLGGPLGKNASFFMDVFHRGTTSSSIVNAIVLNPSFEPSSFSQAVPSPGSFWYISPRVDLQIGSKNVLMVRYHIYKRNDNNQGVGQFGLASQGYNSSETDYAGLQMSDTQILSGRTVNQTRFELRHEGNDQTPLSTIPAINVIGAFSGGGSTQGTVTDLDNYYELQDIATMSLGKHTIIFGGRVRDWDDSNSGNANFNGTFTFPNIAAYQTMEQGLAQGLPFEQIRSLGGGPDQFSITAGNPVARINLVGMDFYAEDQWRVRQNLSLNPGIRFESQNVISDHADIAPRLGVAWGIGRGRSPKMVLRAGFGLFYDRFEEQSALQAERLNGLTQQQYLITDPDFFPTVPPVSALSTLASTATSPTVYNIAPNLRAPYNIESAVGLERQISRNITASVTYLNSHGLHQFLTRNINTPLPGEYDPADPAQGRPFANVSACSVVQLPDCAAGFSGNIYQYESNGLFNQNELITNFSVNKGIVSLFGYYTLNFADSDTDGINSFPSNPYDIFQNYGQALFAIRDRFVTGGVVALPFGFEFIPFVIAKSGTPYNITLGRDLTGSSIFNQRPELIAPGTTGPNIVATPLGTFNVNPALGAPLIPVNWLVGPSSFSFNFHLEKTFGFGKKEDHGGGGGGYHHGHGLGGRGLSSVSHPHWWNLGESNKYNLTFGLSVHNVFNNVNLGQPVGNLGSPLFGRSNSLAGGAYSMQAANRRIDLQIRFNF